MFLLLAAPFSRADSGANQFTGAGIGVFTNAYRVWDGAGFDDAVKLFRNACTNSSATATNFYWLGVGEFHHALQLLGLPASATNKSAPGKALEAAVTALTRAVELDAAHAESHALLGTIYGMQIGEKWVRAVWLGPSVQKHLKLAMANGTNNARVEYLLGTSQFYTASREASRREALATLLKAEKLFEAEAKITSAPLEPRWGHGSCLTFIGSCYEKLGQPDDAETYFRKALTQHPEDSLAKAGLIRVTKNKK